MTSNLPTYIIDIESLGGWFTLIERVLALVYLLQARPLCVKYVDGRRTVVNSTRRSIIRPAWQLWYCPAKGQLISKANFKNLIWTKKQRKYFWISALKSVHFKKPVTWSSFLSKSVVIFVVVTLKMTTLFERNEGCITGSLKWTDFTQK